MGKLDIVKLLVEIFHCNINLQSSEGDTAVSLAAFQNHERVVNYLLEQKADPNLCETVSRSAFHSVVMNNHLESLKIVYNSNRININRQDEAGWTPIMLSINRGNFRLDIVKQILEWNLIYLLSVKKVEQFWIWQRFNNIQK